MISYLKTTLLFFMLCACFLNSSGDSINCGHSSSHSCNLNSTNSPLFAADPEVGRYLCILRKRHTGNENRTDIRHIEAPSENAVLSVFRRNSAHNLCRWLRLGEKKFVIHRSNPQCPYRRTVNPADDDNGCFRPSIIIALNSLLFSHSPPQIGEFAS